jgi:hypothetical protein
MATNVVRVRDKDELALFLGWFSVGLGAAQVAMPRVMSRLVGAHGDTAPRVMRLMGLRELTQGAGILTRPRPTTWVWSRVAGDVLDLALLGLVAARNPRHRRRTAFAAANVLAVTVPDFFEARHLSSRRGEPRAGMLVRKAVTVRKSREEVAAAWRAQIELVEKVRANDASVSFLDAPGDRGTEVVVEFTYAPKAGDLGAAAEKLRGADLATQLADDLRRFKQELETRIVIRSDGTPDGHRLKSHASRPAQPLEEAIQ